MFPPQEVRAGVLQELRERLADLGYTVAGVCARAECPTIYDFRTLRAGRTVALETTDGLDVLIRLFMDGEPLPRGLVADLLGGPTAATLREVGLLDETPAAEPTVAARALLYPTEGLYIASDLEFDPEYPDGRPDTVYPAITQSCQVYLSMLPSTPCDAFLEICSGTGIAALLAARMGGHAWAVDITQRSTDFAAFNAALNGLDNFTALRGDLFDPVRELAFDRIAAHPPYVPSLEQRQIYRDGGEDGEQITRRMFGEVRRQLRPGGRLYCTCVATDRKDAPLDQRVRRMLGEESDDCDVLLFVNRAEPIMDYLTAQVTKRVLDFAAAESFSRAFYAMEIEQFVGCTIVVQRHAQACPPLTLRRHRGVQLAAPDVDAILHWETYPRDATALRSLADVRPRLSPRARMEALHAAVNGAWALERVRILVDEPLLFMMEGSPQAATFLAWCDGTRTVREHRERLIAEGLAGADTPLEGLAEMVRSLLATGVLEEGDSAV